MPGASHEPQSPHTHRDPDADAAEELLAADPLAIFTRMPDRFVSLTGILGDWPPTGQTARWDELIPPMGRGGQHPRSITRPLGRPADPTYRSRRRHSAGPSPRARRLIPTQPASALAPGRPAPAAAAHPGNVAATIALVSMVAGAVLASMYAIRSAG